MRETVQDLNLLTVAVALGVAAMLATGAVIGTQGQTLTAQDGPDTDTSPETDGEFENDSAGSVSPDEVELTVQEAQEIATREANGTVLEIELERENGVPVYEVELTDDSAVREVEIRADDGTVREVERDDDERSARETERGDDADNETRVTVSGTLEASAGEDYRLDGLAIDIGAEWYTSNTTAETDLDGDGTVETIRAEFDGLVGQTVTLTVETDGTEGDVFAVDGEQYRERGPPPWAGGPHGNGPPDHAGP